MVRDRFEWKAAIQPEACIDGTASLPTAAVVLHLAETVHVVVGSLRRAEPRRGSGGSI